MRHGAGLQRAHRVATDAGTHGERRGRARHDIIHLSADPFGETAMGI